MKFFKTSNDEKHLKGSQRKDTLFTEEEKKKKKEDSRFLIRNNVNQMTMEPNLKSTEKANKTKILKFYRQ